MPKLPNGKPRSELNRWKILDLVLSPSLDEFVIGKPDALLQLVSSIMVYIQNFLQCS